MADGPDNILLQRSDDKPDRAVDLVQAAPAASPAPLAAPAPAVPQWWQKFGNWAQMLAPLVTVAAAGAAGWFVSNQIEANRQSGARQMFRSHLELELKHPGFANPNFADIVEAKETSQYASFVVHLLFTCEELTIAMNDDGWRKACESRFAAHPEYLCSDKELTPEDLSTYDLRIQEMVRKVRRDASGRIDECKKWASK